MALQRFYNATDKLVNAFIMGTIKHGVGCASCAVGQMCSGNTHWWYGRASSQDEYKTNMVNMTGYKPREIFEIEKCFEGRSRPLSHLTLDHISSAPTLTFNDQDGFKGLCNVFDYMVSIEDWSEEESQANIFELLQSVN